MNEQDDKIIRTTANIRTKPPNETYRKNYDKINWRRKIKVRRLKVSIETTNE